MKGKKEMKFEGSMVALVTPFRNGKVDEAVFRKLIDFQIEKGTHCLVPCGTTGESPTLSHEEHRRVMSIAVEQADRRVPVICGAGSNSTEEALGLIQYAKKIGADGVLVVTPYYNKPTQEGLYRHYEYLAKKVDIPFILYNIPGRTGISTSPETVARLSKIPNIVGIKEASGSLDQVTQILSLCDITVLSGDDLLTLPMMAVGARGVISVVANILPEKMVRLVHSVFEGRLAEAQKIHYELAPLAKVLFVETNPIPIKAAMAMMGMITPEIRLPLCEMSAENREKLRKVLAALGLLKKSERAGLAS